MAFLKDLVVTGGARFLNTIQGNITNSDTAKTATALSTNAGSTTQPIYFSNGKPVAITGTIANGITGNAATATALTSSAGSATQPVYFSNGKPVAITGTLANSISGNAATATNATNVNIADDTTSKLFVLGATTTGNTRIYRESSVYLKDNVIHGAAWNDYAEYRNVPEETNAGRCVCENGDGTLSLSYKRMQPGANIISDTYGFVIGEDEKANTPLAVSGRVLAYPYEDKSLYLPGEAVCSGPHGTVSRMTREEIKEYPEMIIGTVSEIPFYEEWGPKKIKVNGRIWIKIK